MKNILITGNWKMYLNIEESKALASALKDITINENLTVAVCPSFVALPLVREKLEGTQIKLGAQDIFWEDKGAYTGEVSAEQLRQLVCEYVLAGHSERRGYFGETDETVAKKVRQIAANNLIPVLCIGETKEERDEGKVEDVVKNQLRGGLSLLEDKAKKIVVAYEPRWAIGTGETCEPEDAEKICALIRSELASIGFPEYIHVLYGGSVTDENVLDFVSKDSISGVLPGGASVKVDSFKGIIDKCSKK